MGPQAELIFTGGRVHTVNTRNDIAEAVAVGDGRILAVGSDAAVRALAGPDTRVVRLHGRSLLPGFIDSHAHLASLGIAMTAIDCKAPGMQSIAALQEAVRRRAATHRPGAWIRGRGYDQSRCAKEGPRQTPGKAPRARRARTDNGGVMLSTLPRWRKRVSCGRGSPLSSR